MRGPLALFYSVLLCPSLAWAYGEASETGTPNHRERLLHVLTNQVRQAPHDWPGWDTSLATAEPRTPLALEPGLLEAARYHAVDMAQNGCFTHESCDGTATFTRIGRYFSGPAGENIYLGSSAASNAITGWMNSDGHRVNMLNHDWDWLGTGFASGGRGGYYVQDFGRGGLGQMPSIPGAARDIVGADMRLVANFYDPSGRDPDTFVALVDGAPVDLAHLAGRPGNSTWDATVAAPTGCVGLTFEAVSGGDKTTFPSTGELLVGAACTETFRADKTAPKNDDTIYIDANEPDGGCTCTVGRPGWATLGLMLVGLLVCRRRR